MELVETVQKQSQLDFERLEKKNKMYAKQAEAINLKLQAKLELLKNCWTKSFATLK